MYTNIKNLYNKGGIKRGIKKYNTAGILGPTPYGTNVMPQGFHPSESVVYSQGAETIQNSANEQLDLATEHLNDMEDFNYEQELLSNQEEQASRTGSFFNQALNLGQRKLNIAPNWKEGFSLPTSTTNLNLSMQPGENYGNLMTETVGASPGIDQTLPDFADINIDPSSADFGVTGYGQDLSSNIGTTEVTGINTDMNLVSNPTTTSGGSLLMPTEFNPANTAMAGSAASFIGDAWRNFSDDDDATTLKPGEVGGTLLGSAGRGAGVASVIGSLAPALAVPGLGWAAAGIGALVGGLSALGRRRRARREERKRKKAYKSAVKNQRNAYLNASKSGILGRTYTGQDTGRSIADSGANRQGYLKLGGTPYNYA